MSPEPNAAQQSATIVSRRMHPSAANPGGTVFGGIILAQCDEAAGMAAGRHARSMVATAAIDAVRFREPVRIGDVLTCKAEVNAAFGSSMEVGVRVEAEDTLTGDVRHTNTAYFVMVALDEEGKPTDVPAVEPADEDGERRHREAQERHEARGKG